MQVFIGFLVVMFVFGGTRAGRILHERPLVLLGCCIVVAASFYSLRVVT
jgi:hypothetical protein